MKSRLSLTIKFFALAILFTIIAMFSFAGVLELNKPNSDDVTLVEYYKKTGKDLIKNLLITFVILLVLFSIFTLLTMRSLIQIYRVVLNYQKGDFSDRVGMITKDEIGQLAIGINELMENADSISQEQQQFTEYVSGPMRRPLNDIEKKMEEVKKELSKKNIDRKKVQAHIEKMRKINVESVKFSKMMTEYIALIQKERSISKKEIILKDLFDTVAVLFEEDLKSKKIEIETDIDSKIKVFVDPSMMRVVLGNILINATEYGEKNSILSVKANQEGDFALLSIHNKGIGVPSNELKKLGTPFFRGSNIEGRGSGNGLGLAITKKMILANGGKVAFKSQQNEGMTVEIWIPLTQ